MSITRISTECPLCGAAMRFIRAKNDNEFMGCTAYPRCKFTEAVGLNLDRLKDDLESANDDVNYLRDLVAVLEERIKRCRCE